MQILKTPGVAVGVVYDQQLVWSKGFGYANVTNKKPVTGNSIFRLASISKIFTTVALLSLRDQGALHLDDPITKYVPQIRFKNPFPTKKDITFRQLATHLSGLIQFNLVQDVLT